MEETEIQTFGWAVKQMHGGERVQRAGWNGKGMWLGLIRAGEWTFTNAKWDDFPCAPFIAMKTATGEIVPWLASQTDVLATDWSRVL